MDLLEDNHIPIPENLSHVSPSRMAFNRWIYNTQSESFVKSFSRGGGPFFGQGGSGTNDDLRL
jgi:hypothetical protein